MKFDCKYDAMLEIEKIVRHPRNNNMHPIEQIEAFQRIISKKGVWRIPLIISKKSGFLVAGHLRLTVAESMGLERLPVVYQDFESEADEYQFLTFDNEIARWAKLDRHEVHLALEEIEGLELDDLGIQGFEIQEIKQVEGEDDAPEIDETKTITTLGDVWILGNHRVMCGDSTVLTDVENLMDGQKADITFTSPPYNANAKTGDGDIFNKKKNKEMYSGGYNDNKSSEDYLFFVKNVLEVCFQFTNGFIFWNVSYNAKSRFEYIKQIEDKLYFLIEQICWKKTSTIPFKGSFMRDWEPIYVFSTEKKSIGLKSVTSNHWEISNTGSQQENHKACFPVALPEKGINIATKCGNLVLDPFLGSGSTLIACEKTNRKCYGMELDPKYVDVIIKRWQDFTGKEAIHINGKKFNEYL